LDVRTALTGYLAAPRGTFRSARASVCRFGAASAALVNGAGTLHRSTTDASLRTNSLRKHKARAAHQDSGG